MPDQTTEDFRAGYEAGRRDATRCCLMEIVSNEMPDWRSHNVAIRLAVVAIRAMKPMPDEKTKRCPRCNSPDPRKHPALQAGGEVHVCPHRFHAPDQPTAILDLPTPLVSVTPSGIFIEWHARGLDIEVRVRADTTYVDIADTRGEVPHYSGNVVGSVQHALAALQVMEKRNE